MSSSAVSKLTSLNEATWVQIGSLAEMMKESDKAIQAYEAALRHNPYSLTALTQVAALCRSKEYYPKAADYFQRVLNIDGNNGEVWGALGHCYLMLDDLQKAYAAYQQALYHLPNPREPKLWYGIGVLYDRYGSWEHAEEAFSAVLRLDPNFEKANEICFRLGVIYKQLQKFDLSLQYFQSVLNAPPKPLTENDIWFQIGHVYEQQKEYQKAKDCYERILSENNKHPNALRQLGWLYHQPSNFSNQEMAISYLQRAMEADSNDGQTRYLLGRCYMAQQKYEKAYEAYQAAVYRDSRNPTFWCSIGVLYYQMNQYRDALDAYSRAIRLNPYISEVWYDLGTLYESCNNQIQDALDAYTRALELDPGNPHVKQRLALLRQHLESGENGNYPNQSPQYQQYPARPHEPPLYAPNPSHAPENVGRGDLIQGLNRPPTASSSHAGANQPPPPRPFGNDRPGPPTQDRDRTSMPGIPHLSSERGPPPRQVEGEREASGRPNIPIHNFSRSPVPGSVGHNRPGEAHPSHSHSFHGRPSPHSEADNRRPVHGQGIPGIREREPMGPNAPRRFSGERNVHYPGGMPPAPSTSQHHPGGFAGSGPSPGADMDRRRFSSGANGPPESPYSRQPIPGSSSNVSRGPGDRPYDHYNPPPLQIQRENEQNRLGNIKQPERPSPHLHSSQLPGGQSSYTSTSTSNTPLGSISNNEMFSHGSGMISGSNPPPTNNPPGMGSFPIKSSYPPPSFMNKQLNQRRIDEDYDNDTRNSVGSGGQKMKRW